MQAADFATFAQHLDSVFEALGARRLTPAAQQTWFKHLQHFAARDVLAEIDDCVRTRSKPPACADLWKTLTEKRSEQIERSSEAHKAAEKRDADNLFAGRTPMGDDALLELRKLLKGDLVDPKAWAYRIVDRFCDGDGSINPTQLTMACHALDYSVEDLAVIRRNR